MDRPHLRLARRTATVVIIVAALTLCLLGFATPRASAYPEYMHGGIGACEVCHTDNHTNWVVAGEKCLTCHLDYAVPDLPETCWSCHTPGQDVSGWRSDAACTATCHLADGGVVQHAPHAGGGATCTQCHPLTPSVSAAGDSPHHTQTVPPAPVVSGFSPGSGAAGTAVTVTGTGFRRATGVTFGGVRAAVYRVVSDGEIAAWVPVGARTGPVAVTTSGGTGTSTDPFVVAGSAAPALTVHATPAVLRRGGRVHVTGTLSPAGIGDLPIVVAVQRRAGSRWRAAASVTLKAAADGTFSWSWRPARTGSYRVRAVVPAGEERPEIASRWDAFRVR